LIRNKAKSAFVFFISYFVLFSSCKKNISPGYTNSISSDFSQVFDNFWNGMNEKYLYWDIDTTKWDMVYSRYKPIFNGLNLQNNADVKRSVQYFREMTDGLIDSHCNLTFTAEGISDSVIFPAFDRKIKNIEFHNPYQYVRIDSSMLDAGYYSGYDSFGSVSQVPLFCLSGTIKDKILYFTCNRFSLLSSYTSQNGNSVKPVLDYFFNILANMPPKLKGIILDVRGNRGGDLADLNFIIGRFINSPLHFGYTRYKSGNGRLDYTPWIRAYVNPQSGNNQIKVPIVVLADNFSASLSELMVMAVHAMPNGTFIGETTWGATGVLTESDIYNDGSFILQGFMSVNISSCEFIYLDKINYEGRGLTPDVLVKFNLSVLNTGDDPQLDSAINRIH
jgi:carboxyl-terminal processing protease